MFHYPTAFIALLIAASILISAQPPQKIASGCERGQIIGVESNQSFIFCSASLAQIPGVVAQLKRLNQLAAENSRRQEAIEDFFRQINQTGNLVKSRTNVLSRNLSSYLQQGAQHTDEQLLGDMKRLSDQMAQFEVRLDEAQRNPATALKVRQALASELGDNLANLRPDKASETLDAIAHLSKKIDDLALRIDCSTATPDALAVALQGRAAERTLSLWHCRPENTATGRVQTAFVLLFTENEFRTAAPFLDHLVATGFNPLKEIKPLNGPLLDPSNPSGPLLARYFYAPIYRPLMEGDLTAIKWVIDNAPSGYWEAYPKLMEDTPAIMRLPWAPISPTTAAEAIALLRKAGVSVSATEYKAFRTTYAQWLATQMPTDLRAPMEPPNQVQLMMARQMGYSLNQRAPLSKESDLWKAVSEALAPTEPDLLRKEKSDALTQLTQNQLAEASKVIQEVTDQLARARWYRKLPETPANLAEAAGRQNANVFDTFGYVSVSANEVRDDDVARNQFYPNCDCITVKDLRDRLARATQRRDSVLRFRSTYAN